MPLTLTELVGSPAAALTTLSFLPQVINIWRTRTATAFALRRRAFVY